MVEALNALHPDEMSPRDALEAIYALKAQLAKAKKDRLAHTRTSPESIPLQAAQTANPIASAHHTPTGATRVMHGEEAGTARSGDLRVRQHAGRRLAADAGMQDDDRARHHDREYREHAGRNEPML